MERMRGGLRELLAEGRYAEACSLLHQAHAADVERFVRSLKRSGPVDDLCQEVWLAARQALPRFRLEAMPRTWLFGIARRRIADERRQSTRRMSIPLSSSVETLERALLPRVPSTPASRLARKRRAEALVQELERLEPMDRELLELRFVEGLPPSRIVEVLALGDTPHAISQRLLRLVRRLRDRLRGRREFGPDQG